LRCARCEYDLRGLPLEGQCPECGHIVRASFDARAVALTPHELDALKRWLHAVRLLIPGAFLGLLMGAVALSAVRIGSVMLQGLAAIFYVCALATVLFTLAGGASRAARRVRSLRRMGLGMLAGAGVWLLGTLGALVGQWTTGPFGVVCGQLASVALAVVVLLFLLYLDRLGLTLLRDSQTAGIAHRAAVQLGAVALLFEGVVLYWGRLNLNALLPILAFFGLAVAWSVACRYARKLGNACAVGPRNRSG